MKTSINFRATRPQHVCLPLSGESVVTFVGVCPLTGQRLYECDSGNDPRGPLGKHAVHEFVAEEYGMTGPALAVSWIAVNDSREMYEQGLRLAMAQWEQS
jgi:hypothetical protein